MASPIGVAAFAFRDLIKYVLPTTLAVALFLPLFSPGISLDHLFFTAVLIGYVFSLFTGDLYQRISWDKRLTECEEQKKICLKCWDYKTLTVLLTKDESETLYLTDSYAALYLLISAYLLAYGVAMTGITAYGVWTSPPGPPLDFWNIASALLDPHADTVAGLKAPSFLLGAVGFILARKGWTAFLDEYETLHLFYYPAFAAKYHRSGHPIARTVWGQVTQPVPKEPDATQPVANTAVEILDGRGRVLHRVTTDQNGTYLFPGVLSDFIGRYLTIRLPDYPKRPSKVILLRGDQVPEFGLSI